MPQGNETWDQIDHLKGFGEANTRGVEALFVEYLHFLAVTLDFDAHCVCVRAGALQPVEPGQFKHKHPPLLCIEDPFDRADNVARSLTDGTVKRVRLEFYRAFEVMRHTGDFARLCQASARATPLFLIYISIHPSIHPSIYTDIQIYRYTDVDI